MLYRSHSFHLRFLTLAALWAGIGVLALSSGCGLKKLNRELIPPDRLHDLPSHKVSDEQKDKSDGEFLKVHMLNGNLYVLEQWAVQAEDRLVTGQGYLYDANRLQLEGHSFTIDLDSVAIFETNTLSISSTIVPMTIITGASLVLTVYCLTNPKACFGSCPTIYTSVGGKEVLQAEGFSASVAPSLEATDIDILHFAESDADRVTLKVKNEALETHVIRSLDLLAVPRTRGQQVFHAIDGGYFEATAVHEPSLSSVGGNDILSKVRFFDGNEYFSTTDSTNLAEKEVLELSFENVDCDNAALVIGCRQTLLSTYLFYKGLGYLGTQAGDWIAKMERGNDAARHSAGSIGRTLGGIDVLVEQPDGEFSYAASINETGPLATDIHLVPLPDFPDASEPKVRLRMTRGHWRIDYLALACVHKAPQPVRIRPSAAYHEAVPDDSARQRLLDSTRVLTTLPGDEYELVYELPGAAKDYELFVSSRGYYIEWMRDEWLDDEDLSRAAMMFLYPEQALKTLAPEYKQIEAEMEEIFWNSKYVK